VRPGLLRDIFSACESAESADRADSIDEYRDLAMLARAWENGSFEPKAAEEATGRVDDAEGEEEVR